MWRGWLLFQLCGIWNTAGKFRSCLWLVEASGSWVHLRRPFDMPYSKPLAFASLLCTICQCLNLSYKTRILKEQYSRNRNGCQVLNTVTAQALSSCLIGLHVKALLTTLRPLSQPHLLRELCLMSSSSEEKSCTPSLLQWALDQDFGDSHNLGFLTAGMT